MLSLIEALQEMTELLVQQIDDVNEEQIEFFIEQRGQIIDQLKSMEIGEAEIHKYGNAIQSVLEYDPLILNKLESLRDEARKGITKVNIARVHNNAYKVPYSADSYYFDKKK